MMTRRIISAAGGVAVSIAAGFGLTGHALAEAFKDKGGRVVFVPTSVEDAKQADGSTVRKVSSTGISIADLPFPFDYMKSQCTGTLLVAADGKPGRAVGSARSCRRREIGPPIPMSEMPLAAALPISTALAHMPESRVARPTR